MCNTCDLQKSLTLQIEQFLHKYHFLTLESTCVIPSLWPENIPTGLGWSVLSVLLSHALHSPSSPVVNSRWPDVSAKARPLASSWWVLIWKSNIRKCVWLSIKHHIIHYHYFAVSNCNWFSIAKTTIKIIIDTGLLYRCHTHRMQASIIL